MGYLLGDRHSEADMTASDIPQSAKSHAVNATITYCPVCFGYRERAIAVANELRRRFDAATEVRAGKIGQFDVVIDGELVISRGTSVLSRMRPSRPPDVSRAVDTIERHLSTDRAEIPRAD